MKKTILTDILVIVAGVALAYPIIQMVVTREVAKQMAIERANFAKFAVSVSEVSPPALDAVANALEINANGLQPNFQSSDTSDTSDTGGAVGSSVPPGVQN